ncbi:MAG: hypothetical protein P4L67_04540 [Candidatus Pacebacteria bacterium]|nr:hypothetical protein [Candidatus Paceibacterota bacterium]
MTRSKLRRAIREKIDEKLSSLATSEIRSLLVLIADTMVDYLDEESQFYDADDCFIEVKSVLNDAGIDPEQIGREILEAEQENSLD